MSEKKKSQLGMNPSTAAARLVKDVLWHLVMQTGMDECCKCGEKMERETFSIEHLKPWLDSDDPVGLFFDIANIGFSHLRCNIADARKPAKIYATHAEQRSAKERRRRGKRPYSPEKRRLQYLTRGT